MGDVKKKGPGKMVLLLGVLIVALLAVGFVGWQNPDSYPGKLVAPLKHYWNTK